MKLKGEIAKINPNAKVIKTIFRPQPLSDIKGKKVLMVMTARREIEAKIRKYMEKEYSCHIIGMTFNLSNRKYLRKDLSKFSGYDTIITELKAASVDVVTDFAFKNKKDIVYLNNTPIIIGDEDELEEELANIYNKIKF